MKRALGRVGLIAFGLLAGFAITEWALSSLMDAYQCDDEQGWVFEPGSRTIKLSRIREHPPVPVTINSGGFRDPEREVAKPGGGFRIAVLGDSIPAALQVPDEQTFVRRVEQRLSSEAAQGRELQVINAAVDGYGTGQELLNYQSRVAPYEPDIVILSMYPGNDLSDNSTESSRLSHYLERRCGRPYFELVDGEAISRHPASHWRPRSPNPLDRLLRFSRLYGNLVPLPQDDPALRTVDRFRTASYPPLERAWAITGQLVRQIRREVERHGGQLVVMSVPSKFEAGQWQRPDFDPAIHDRAEPLRRLGEFLASEGLLHLELTPDLARKVEEGARPYFEVDSHFNEKGHEFVADTVVSWLLDHCATLGLPAGPCRS